MRLFMEFTFFLKILIAVLGCRLTGIMIAEEHVYEQEGFLPAEKCIFHVLIVRFGLKSAFFARLSCKSGDSSEMRAHLEAKNRKFFFRFREKSVQFLRTECGVKGSLPVSCTDTKSRLPAFTRISGSVYHFILFFRCSGIPVFLPSGIHWLCQRPRSTAP